MKRNPKLAPTDDQKKAADFIESKLSKLDGEEWKRRDNIKTIVLTAPGGGTRFVVKPQVVIKEKRFIDGGWVGVAKMKQSTKLISRRKIRGGKK
jgi:hypothetical protein